MTNDEYLQYKKEQYQKEFELWQKVRAEEHYKNLSSSKRTSLETLVKAIRAAAAHNRFLGNSYSWVKWGLHNAARIRRAHEQEAMAERFLRRTTKPNQRIVSHYLGKGFYVDLSGMEDVPFEENHRKLREEIPF